MLLKPFKKLTHREALLFDISGKFWGKNLQVMHLNLPINAAINYLQLDSPLRQPRTNETSASFLLLLLSSASQPHRNCAHTATSPDSALDAAQSADRVTRI